MRIVVCIKIVEGELNPFDACALEAALRIEGGEVTVLSMSPMSAAEKLRDLSINNGCCFLCEGVKIIKGTGSVKSDKGIVCDN